MDDQHEILRNANALARLLLASKITVEEYASNVMEKCAFYEHIDRPTILSVAHSVPGIAKSKLHEVIALALAPNFRYREIFYGGPGPSLAQREATRLCYEQRYIKFASELSAALDTITPTSS